MLPGMEWQENKLKKGENFDENFAQVVAPKLDHGMVGKFEVTLEMPKDYFCNLMLSAVMATC